MKQFLDADFLLDTEAAKRLFHEYAADMPIIDYHCHISPQDIYEDRRYENLTQLWLGVGGSHFGDHYKWRLMRACGVPEDEITGVAPDELRFQRWAECLSCAPGNPLYHWNHMELKKYFGFEGALNGRNAQEVYALCNEKLRGPSMSVRGIIEQSNVKVICTTDDPADSLEWHRLLAADGSFETKVLPAWRPDKARSIEASDYPAYLARLGTAADVEIDSFESLKQALIRRLDWFETCGCRVSDHGLDYVTCAPAGEREIETIFARRLAGVLPTEEERQKFYTALLSFLGGEYARRGWVMQLHFGAKRNNNSLAFAAMGADTGYDCIGPASPMGQLTDFLDLLERNGSLPKTILYSLNPNDNAAIDSIIGCFQDASARGKLQHGAAWWFNDHFQGMTEQLTSLANQGVLGNFVGMLTDSRSFLSYTRHEYFRRILCRLLGRWVEDGLYPADWEQLETIVKDVSCRNAEAYFGFAD